MSDERSSTPAQLDTKHGHRTLGLWPMWYALATCLATAICLVVITWFMFNWLIGSPPKASPKPLEVTTQLELAKLAFATVAGLGALVALVTGYRRQRIDEAAQILAQKTASDTAHDAAERRITELYGQSVEQLGHEHAAVRLGGLYALERLAQDNPDHRETVVSVICAYLRMPFLSQEIPASAPRGVTYPLNLLETLDREGQQELQVRLAAQSILRSHLIHHQGSSGRNYWSGIVLNLSGAELIHFSLQECKVFLANFEGARFIGHTGFYAAEFNIANFIGSVFQGSASYEKATFRLANFDNSTFAGAAGFKEATFGDIAAFDNVAFNDDAIFARASFRDSTYFRSAKFTAAAIFVDASIKEARFQGAEFSGYATFQSARFDAEPDFYGATASHPNADHVWPARWRTDSLASEGMAPLVNRD
ncbi:pentapeptide repeat-containing protein [Streptomyces sp. NPDC059175]|uniref:pentapeptide repeat-containing protein n=1 Tax=Streptomyces sp. NPDC059175 TaxID=3346757 RepID=UPI0036AFE441